jgi:murein L,D-transpeptidase YafK
MKQLFLYLLKTIQFRLATWKNKFEIGKAYNPHRTVYAHWRRILVLGGCGVALIVAVSILGIRALLHTPHAPSSSQRPAKRVPASRTAHTSDNSVESISQKKKKIIHGNAISRVLSPKVTDSIKGEYASTARTRSDIPRSISYAPRRALYANKRLHRLLLLRYRSDAWHVLKTFPIATGENHGDKVREGDKKTPEGTYFIIGRREDRELASIYGPCAYILNYPNREDIIKAKTGNGIWIHGTAPDSTPINTRGCIELSNRALRELSDSLRLGIGIPVIISDGIGNDSLIDMPSYDILSIKRGYLLAIYETTQRHFKKILQQWENAWEAQDIDRYSSFYDTVRFRGGGLDWPQWRAKKLRTFQIYDRIEVGLSDITVTEFSNDKVIVKFIQDYRSENFHANGGKKFVFQKKDGAWKIIRENVFPREELVL